jgi:nucleoside-diphosphate-sugar epimerase
MIALVTGATGQVGGHPIDELGARAIAPWHSAKPHRNNSVERCGRPRRRRLLDEEKLRALSMSEPFDAIFHLAGLNPLFPPMQIIE